MDHLLFIFSGENCVSVKWVVQLLISAWLAILFLQSGLDKFIDWDGNYGWLKGHFANSPLKKLVPFMLGTISVIEISAGALCGAGFFIYIFTGDGQWALYGHLMAAISLLCLFFGQRVAKEYQGAAALVPYFLLVVFGMWLFT